MWRSYIFFYNFFSFFVGVHKLFSFRIGNSDKKASSVCLHPELFFGMFRCGFLISLVLDSDISLALLVGELFDA